METKLNINKFNFNKKYYIIKKNKNKISYLSNLLNLTYIWLKCNIINLLIYLYNNNNYFIFNTQNRLVIENLKIKKKSLKKKHKYIKFFWDYLFLKIKVNRFVLLSKNFNSKFLICLYDLFFYMFIKNIINKLLYIIIKITNNNYIFKRVKRIKKKIKKKIFFFNFL